VVAAFYPLAWAAEEVGGRRVSVANLTPPGTEPHDLELTPDQRDAIEDADVVLVLGEGFQPAVEDAAAARDAGTVELLRRLGIRDTDDPHVWLDPELMARIVDETARALSAADPRGARRYAANAAAVTEQLAALDARYTTGLADCQRRLVVTAHAAFGYLAAAYGLRQEGVAGLAPDAEPNPARLAKLADLVEREGVTTVFTEELVSPDLARTLAREAGGVAVAVLNPLEGLTAKELRAGDDYVTVMDRNLARLRAALGCA
jgi:zinc transport system substrate-binding protein